MEQTTQEPYDLAEARAVLSRTPGVLRAFFVGLPDAWLQAREAPEAWTPLQVLGHLVEAERGLWIGRARTILEKGEQATFPAFDREGHIELHRDKNADQLLTLFEEFRQKSLVELDSLELGPEALARKGSHPAFGTVTLSQLLAT